RRFFVSPSRLASPVEDLLRRVLRNEKQAHHRLDTEAVHDLRTALRRTRSLAEDFAEFDKRAVWQELRRTAKSQQRGLADLRDAHVMAEVARELRLNEGHEGEAFTSELDHQMRRGQHDARESLDDFSRKRWKYWAHTLPDYAGGIAIGESRLARVVLRHLEEV